MDFSEVLDKVKEKFSEIKDSVLEWVGENRMMSIMISALVLVILICCLLLAALSSQKKKSAPVTKETLEITEQLLIPGGPELPRDYTLSRQTKDKWTDDEAAQWFTTPTEKEINSLSKSNENMINEIIRAAP